MADCMACSQAVNGIGLYAKPSPHNGVDPYDIYHPVCFAIVHETDLTDQEALSALYSQVGMDRVNTWR